MPNVIIFLEKTMRIIIMLLTVVSLVGCSSPISIRSQIDIEAPIELVFSTLLDFESYPEWNPYHKRVVGRPELGAGLEVTVQRPDGQIIEVPAVHIIRLRDNAEITWGGGIRGVFYGEHVFELQKLDSNKTRLKHNEDFEGIFIGFADLPADVLTQGYEQMNEALKIYIEGNVGSE